MHDRDIMVPCATLESLPKKMSIIMLAISWDIFKLDYCNEANVETTLWIYLGNYR